MVNLSVDPEDTGSDPTVTRHQERSASSTSTCWLLALACLCELIVSRMLHRREKDFMQRRNLDQTFKTDRQLVTPLERTSG